MFGFEKDNPGSTLVEVLVVILIVLFVGLTALLIVRTEHTKTKTIATQLSSKSKTTPIATIPNDTPPQGTPPVKVSTTTSPPTTQQSNQTSFTIASLGIKLTLPNSMADLTYSSSTSSSGVTTVNFSTATITRDAPTCSASSGQGTFDSIIRASGQYPLSAPPSEGLIKQEPAYFIAYILPSGPCATGLSPSTQSLLDEQAQDFYSALSSIQIT